MGFFFRLFVFVVVFQLSFATLGQESRIQFEHLNTEDGLSQNSVLDMVQDKKGFMWFGTYAGLNRYDGYQFKVFLHNSSDSTSLSNSLVRSVCLDSVGNLWVGTVHGLNRYVPETESFERYIHNPADTNSISNNSVYKLYCDDKGIVWVCTRGGGVNRIDVDVIKSGNGKMVRKYRFAHIQPEKEKRNNYEMNKVSGIIKSASGDYWMSSGIGLNKINFNGVWETYSYNPIDSHSLSDDGCSCLVEDRHGYIWVGTWGGGLNVFDPKTKKFYRVPNDSGNPSFKGDSHFVMMLYADRKGNVWAGSWGSLRRYILPEHLSANTGLNDYMKQISVTDFNSVPGDIYSIKGTNFYSIYEDRSNVFWIGTDWDGINKYDMHSNYIRHIYHDSQNSNSLSNNVAFSLCAEDDSLLWVGTLNGLNLWNRKQSVFTRFVNDPNNKHSISSNVVNGLIKDRKGQLWIGTQNGLNQYNRQTSQFSSYGLDTTVLNVQTMFEDRLDEHLWLGAYECGLLNFDKRTKQLKAIPDLSPLHHELRQHTVRCIAQDEDGWLWIGTESMGLFHYNPADGQLFRYAYQPGNASGISSDKIVSLFVDSHHTLWVATVNGLSKLIFINDDHSKAEFKTYKVGNGVDSDQLSALCQDTKGRIWISTNKGIFEFDPTNDTFRKVELRFGIRNREFLSNAIYFDSKTSEIFVGSINGISIILTNHVKKSNTQPTVQLTGLRIFNQSIGIGERVNDRVVLVNAIQETKELILTHRENVFGFDFSTLHFSSPELNTYAFKLEGFDRDWNYVGNQRSATYTNLSPGKYVFKVKGANCDGVWSTESAQITVVILPPWWKTLAFRISFVLLSVLIISILVGFKFFNLRKQKEILSQMVAVRTQQLSERTHELSEMNEELKDRQLEISIQNEELTLHRNHLEQLVEERTHQLRKAKEKAEESDQLKTAFLANMSHEIRTPMNAIIGFTALLESDELDVEEKQNYIGIIRNNGNALISLINDILDISMLEANQLNLIKSDFYLDSLLREIFSCFQLANQKHIDFLLDMPDEMMSLKMHSDVHRVRQVINNFLSNSFKFTSSGFIRLGCYIQNNQVIVYVADSGIGIEENDKGKIFSQFHKIDSDDSKYHPGTGIGLSIAKRLVLLLGGEIWFESEIQKGSRFSFSLPLSNPRG